MIQLVENILHPFRILAASSNRWPGFGNPNTWVRDVQRLKVAVRAEETEIPVVTLWWQTAELLMRKKNGLSKNLQIVEFFSRTYPKVTANIVQAHPSYFSYASCETIQRSPSSPVLITDSALEGIVTDLAQGWVFVLWKWKGDFNLKLRSLFNS